VYAVEHCFVPMDAINDKRSSVYEQRGAELLEPGGLLYFVSPNEYSLANVLATLRNRFGNGNALTLCPYTGSYHLKNSLRITRFPFSI
jgi:hypothetical protein